MEEFKKPCLPDANLNIEKDYAVKRTKVNSDIQNDNTSPTSTQNPYKVPQWSDKPRIENNYSFEVLKSGQIIDNIKELQKKAYWSFGRLPENDIEMAHPTISRFHAILQYRPAYKKPQNVNAVNEEDKDNLKNEYECNGPPEGWYIYDLGSTHGTFLNKQRIPSKVYIRIRVGHLLRLGASSRSYILKGPSVDEEPESELSITELKAIRQKELDAAAFEKKRLADEAVEIANNEGCNWGMAEDADAETDLSHNPYASTENEELFLQDPKKTLRGYFEREGLELIYKCDEMSAGSFVCRVELPIDDANGRSIVAEVVHKGKKKECVIQCALEACRILDRHGVLRQSKQEPLKRKQKSQGSDSDDDEFLDRTGDVARKKQRKATANNYITLTYEDLLKQEAEIDEQIKQIELKLNDYKEQQQHIKAHKSNEGEDLDEFMENLQEKEMKFDKTEIRRLRIQEQHLVTEKQRLKRLIKVAKPVGIPFSMQTTEKNALKMQSGISSKKQLPIIGKRNQFSKFKIIQTESKEIKPAKFSESNEEVEDEESEDKDCEEKNFGKELRENESEKCNVQVDGYAKHVRESENLESQADNKESEGKSSLQSLSGFEDKCKDVASSNKKRRQRIRQRSKREEVDMNDDLEYESSEKYAKWIPPENQTGDGFTELNKKFGY